MAVVESENDRSSDAIRFQCDELLRGLGERVPPIYKSWRHRLELLIGAIVVLALPILYLALIGLVVKLASWHVSAHRYWIGRAWLFGTVGYIALVVVSVLVVVCLVKPLFARRSADADDATVLSREEAPLLFAAVERVAKALRTPLPSRIAVDMEVNASAGLCIRRWRDVFLPRLELTIGLPLVAGLDSRQLLGVIAHELGHFTQGAGFRLEFAIAQVVQWLYGLAYERDDWDEWCQEALQSGVVLMFISGSALAVIWTIRLAAILLLLATRASSASHLRQREFHADRYEYRLTGGEVFVATFRRLPVLSNAVERAWDIARNSLPRKRLPEDIPALMIRNLAVAPVSLLQPPESAAAKTAAGWFSSHPADAERIAAASASGETGLLQTAQNSSNLFADFPLLSRRISQESYRRAFGVDCNGCQFVPNESLFRRSDPLT